jgi:hypothetical protein
MEMREYARHLFAGENVRYKGEWYIVRRVYVYATKHFPTRAGYVELALTKETDVSDRIVWFEMPISAMVTVRG